MNRILSLALVAALFGTAPIAAFGQSSNAAIAAPLRTLTIPLRSENGTNETGTATFVQRGPDLVVTIRVSNPTAATQPAHIHKGPCPDPEPSVSYAFAAIVNRRSQSTLPNVTIAQLTSSKYSVNIHKSAKEMSIYAACGEITAR